MGQGLGFFPGIRLFWVPPFSLDIWTAAIFSISLLKFFFLLVSAAVVVLMQFQYFYFEVLFHHRHCSEEVFICRCVSMVPGWLLQNSFFFVFILHVTIGRRRVSLNLEILGSFFATLRYYGLVRFCCSFCVWQICARHSAYKWENQCVLREETYEWKNLGFSLFTFLLGVDPI